jgi:hypothetical protein
MDLRQWQWLVVYCCQLQAVGRRTGAQVAHPTASSRDLLASELDVLFERDDSVFVEVGAVRRNRHGAPLVDC